MKQNKNVSKNRLHRLFFLFSIVVCLTITSHVAADSIQQPTIAIVIDDMGNKASTGQQLIDLPFPLTFAFLPNRKHTLPLINKAKAANHEIILHAPMENSLGIKLGPGGLNTSMSEMQIKQTLRRSFIAVPNMIGLNNHMGSTLTENAKFMSWVMETVKQHPFYFLDSRTSAKSVAAKTARQHHIPTLKRDVFLDHKQNRKFVQKQFNKLIDIAKEKGSAIAIGHPHSVTVDYLKWALERLDERGIRIATASVIWQIQNPETSMEEFFKQRLAPKLASLPSSRSL